MKNDSQATRLQARKLTILSTLFFHDHHTDEGVAAAVDFLL